MKVTRNPQDIDVETGGPRCYGNYSDDSQLCTHHCGYALSCSNETDNEEKRRGYRDLRGPDGRRSCFGHLYSEYSEECENQCRQSFDCADVMMNDELRDFKSKSPFSPKTSVPTTLTGIRSQSLNVIQQKPPAPTMPFFSPQQSYTNPFTSTPYSNTSYSSTQQTYQNPNYVDEKTQAYIKAKYGVGLKPDPTVPGQFEGEEWYVRFFKEVFKYAGYYALQLLGHILVNNRWGPNNK